MATLNIYSYLRYDMYGALCNKPLVVSAICTERGCYCLSYVTLMLLLLQLLWLLIHCTVHVQLLSVTVCC
jgi:hypothetical protein